MLKVYSFSFSPRWRRPNARGLSVMSITKRIVFREMSFMCLCVLAVLGDLAVLKPRERRLHNSIESENKYSNRLSPRPLNESDSSFTSHFDIKLRLELTKCAGHPSISLNMSKMAMRDSVRLLSSLICSVTCFMAFSASSRRAWSALLLLVCLRISLSNKLMLGKRCTGRIIRSWRLCRPHSGFVWLIFRKAWKRGYSRSQYCSCSFICS